MTFEIVSATEADYPLVQNLARFYVYDMAEHAGWNFPADGLFSAGDQFANYFGLPGGREWPSGWRGFPFLLRVDGHSAGFALVKRIAEQPLTFDMGEFFIGRQHRRLGLGRRAATLLFDRFEGDWEVREMLSNVAAQAFWRRIIADYTGGTFTEARETFPAYGDREFIVQRFCSKTAP